MDGRWDALFADLSAEMEAAEAAELDAEVGERTLIELATVPLADRLRASDAPVRLHLAGGAVVSGAVRRAGADWVLVAEPGGDVVVPLAAVRAVDGLSRHAAPPSRVDARLPLRSPLRRLAVDERPVRVTTTDGATRPGRITRVGADHLDLAGDDGRTTTLPFGALTAVRGDGIRD